MEKWFYFGDHWYDKFLHLLSDEGTNVFTLCFVREVEVIEHLHEKLVTTVLWLVNLSDEVEFIVQGFQGCIVRVEGYIV